MDKLVVGLCTLGLLALLVFFAVSVFTDGAGPAAVDPQAPTAAEDRRSPVESAVADPRRVVREPGAASVDERPSPGKLLIRVLRHPDRSPVAGAVVSVADFQELMRRISALPAPSTRAARRQVRVSIAVEVTTDATGTARLAAPGERHLIEVRSGTLFGRRYVHKVPDGPIEIRIAEDRDLRVRVLHASNRQPVAGAWVSWQRRGSGTAQRAGDDGMVTFAHAQTQLLLGDGWEVFLAAPLRRRVAAPVTFASLTAAPIELLMPDVGGLAVRVRDERGRPVSGRMVRLSLQAFTTRQREADSMLRDARISGVGADGIARCRQLDLGLFLRVSAEPRGRESVHKPVVVDIAGPRQPGETVTCDLRWGAEPSAFYPVVTGRFVRQNGTPWTAVSLSSWPQVFPYTGVYTASEDLEVPDGGRFRLVLRKACPQGGKRIYRLRTKDLPGGTIECRLDLSRQFPPGVTDLGDVVLDRGVLLAAGKLVDDAGQPVLQADIRVCQLALGKRRDYWPEIDCSGGRTVSQAGEFAVFAIPGKPLPTRRLRLRVHSRGLRSNEDVEFQIGANGLRVVLQRGGAIAGSVALADGQAADDLRVTLVQGRRRLPMTLKEDGSFGDTGLAAGSASLRVGLNTGNVELRRASQQQIDGLEIRPGQTNRDPRIQGLVCVGQVPRLQLTVVDAAGSPVRGAEATADGQLSARADARGCLTLRPAKLPADIEVAAFGFRRQRLDAVGADQRVVLRRGLPVRFVTDVKTIGRDPAYHLGFFLYHVDAKGRASKMVYGGLYLYQRRYFDGKGEARLSLPAPGIYQLAPWVFLSGKDGVGTGDTIPQREVQRFTVLETLDEQVFRPQISAAALAETVRRLAR